jgi:ABC-type sugar transport system permease subunit
VTPIARRRLGLGLGIFLVLGSSVVAGGIATKRAVAAAHRDLLRAETDIAVALYRERPPARAFFSIFGSRWSLTGGFEPQLYETTLYERPDGLAARATVYDADGWSPVSTAHLSAGPQPRIPATTGVALGTGLVLLLAAALLWVRVAGPGLIASAVLVTALVGGSLAVVRNWAMHELVNASERRMATATAALRSLPDLDSVISRPGGVALLTGLDFLVRDTDGRISFSTLPAAATSDLAATTGSVRGRLAADRVDYAVADVERVRLVQLPYEHTYRPTGMLVAIACTGLLVALLLRSLSGLAGQPRVFRENVVAWTFLTPALVHLAVFTVGPLGFAAWLSLHRWSLLDAARPFVGFANYLRLLGDAPFWNALRNTAVFTLHVPVSMALALAVALIVHRKVRGIVLLRATFFLPTVTSLVAVAMVWQWMLNDEYGLLNWLLSLAGLEPVRWLTSPATALVSIMLMSVWLVMGYQMILFQAGLAAIPQHLYDAARIDGAGPVQRFVHVTLPGLRHTLFFVLVTSVIGSFQIFGAVYVMTEGGPLRATDVAVFHIYEEAWEFFRFGDAAAMSWVLFAVIFVLTWLQFRIVERRAESAA